MIVHNPFHLLLFLALFIPFVLTPNLVHSQVTDWEAFKTQIRNIRQGRFLPEWTTPPYDACAVLAEVLPPSSPTSQVEQEGEEYDQEDISPMMAGRYGYLTGANLQDMFRILHMDFATKDFIPHTLSAHGVEENKGGLGNLINIIITGTIFGHWWGPLIYGDPSMAAGNHGPFFIILDPSQTEAMKGFGMTYPAHSAYLVPSEKEKRIIGDFVEAAQEKGLLIPTEATEIKKKILTYRDFITLSQQVPQAMHDPSLLAETLLNGFQQ